MKRRVSADRRILTLVTIVAFLACSVRPTYAESPIKLQHWSGTITSSTAGPASFDLAGAASHLGQFTGYGEVEFLPVGDDGALVGAGPVVLQAADGDLLVGVVTWDVAAESGAEQTAHLHFSWRDAVTVNDGTTVASTGRFATSRPPGLVVLAIIAVFIGLLLPAPCTRLRDCG
jgi:hypothetical protein